VPSLFLKLFIAGSGTIKPSKNLQSTTGRVVIAGLIMGWENLLMKKGG